MECVTSFFFKVKVNVDLSHCFNQKEGWTRGSTITLSLPLMFGGLFCIAEQSRTRESYLMCQSVPCCAKHLSPCFCRWLFDLGSCK
jgi:hypothetical protein